MDSESRYSIHVSRTLDCLGYNADIVSYRVRLYKTLSDFITNTFPMSRGVFVGSKGEGLSAKYQGDIDYMAFELNILCSENPRLCEILTFPSVLKMDTRDSSPGYLKLKLVKVTNDHHIESALVSNRNKGIFLSSEIFRNYSNAIGYYNSFPNVTGSLSCKGIVMGTSGPAGTRKINQNGSILYADLVHCFYCKYPSLLNKWINRHRKYNWPPGELLLDIEHTETGYLVPVGPKGSDDQHLEWRICFTTIEQKLIHSLNDSQTKLYVLLKIVAKELIKPSYVDITSYVMKNIVLWMAELVPEDQFREHLLIDRMMQALRYLNFCVKMNCLPSFMIPERNILAQKMTYPHRMKLSNALNQMVECGGVILLSCENFKYFSTLMYKVPDATVRFRFKRDMVEKLELLDFFFFLELCFKKLYTNRITEQEQIDAIMNNDPLRRIVQDYLKDLVIPEWRMLNEQIIDPQRFNFIYKQKLNAYLS